MKRALVFLVMLVFWGAVLELPSRWWLRNYGNSVDQIIHALRPDNQLLWRQRAGLSLRLWDKNVKLNEFGFRHEGEWKLESGGLLLLGPSSGFGWGVEAGETYLAGISRITGEQSLNASEIGFSSRQGLSLSAMPEMLALRPRIVLIAYGVNDVDRFRFFGDNRYTDEESLERLAKNPGSNTLPASAFLYLVNRVATGLRAEKGCGLAYVPRVRVSAEEFAQNMLRIAGEWKKRGAEPVFLTTPLKGAAADVQASTPAEDLYASSAASAQAGRCAEAAELFRKARGLEPARILAEVSLRNRLLMDKARGAGVKTVALHTGLLGDADYLDPVHPTAAGHAKIARIVSDALMKKEPR